jgi:hypothetical protein
MPKTYEPINSTTIGSPTNTLTFSSIPSTYTDLILVAAGSGVTFAGIAIQLNGDAGSNYSRTVAQGYGSTTATYRESNISTELGTAALDTTQSNAFIHFMNYSNTTTYKTFLSRWNIPTTTTMSVCLWRSTAAINSIRVTSPAGSGNYSTGTVFTLYGIKAA